MRETVLVGYLKSKHEEPESYPTNFKDNYKLP